MIDYCSFSTFVWTKMWIFTYVSRSPNLCEIKLWMDVHALNIDFKI